MLQALLEDRFKLRVHLETREVDGYALTIAKSGIKFKETSGDATAGRAAPAAVPGATSPIARGAGGRGDGGPCRVLPGSKASVRGKCGIKELSTYVGKMLLLLNIADKTGLMGIYNIDFLEAVYLHLLRGKRVRAAVLAEGDNSPRQYRRL
jgi:uncharacterized protein (TIGR03435 family)